MNFRKIRKFGRNVRAISPVIATLLMIAIAVVASLVTYAWVMGYMNFTTSKTGKSILIQSVSNSTGNTPPTKDSLNIYIQNSGDSAVVFNAQSVFINGTMAATNITVNNPVTLAPGLTTTINAILASNLPVGTVTFVVDLKVTTQDGTFSTQTVTFPT
jgi:flagellin-like protein